MPAKKKTHKRWQKVKLSRTISKYLPSAKKHSKNISSKRKPHSITKAKQSQSGDGGTERFDTFVEWYHDTEDNDKMYATIQIKLKTPTTEELPDWVTAENGLNALLRKTLVTVECKADECNVDNLFAGTAWPTFLMRKYHGELDHQFNEHKQELISLLKGDKVLQKLEESIKANSKFTKITLEDLSVHQSELEMNTPVIDKLPLALTRPLLHRDGLSWYAKRGYKPAKSSQASEIENQKNYGESTLNEIFEKAKQMAPVFKLYKDKILAAQANIEKQKEWESIKNRTVYDIFDKGLLSPGNPNYKNNRDFILQSWLAQVWGFWSNQRVKQL